MCVEEKKKMITGREREERTRQDKTRESEGREEKRLIAVTKTLGFCDWNLIASLTD